MSRPRQQIVTCIPRDRCIDRGTKWQALAVFYRPMGRALRSRQSTFEFDAAVRGAIVSRLPHGHPGIRGSAEAAGCSVRTLQRRLAGKGLSYRRVIDEVRFRETHDLLRDTRLRLIDIAYQLGFTDASSFTRAFERWAGMAPRVYRRRLFDGRAIWPAPRPQRRAATRG